MSKTLRLILAVIVVAALVLLLRPYIFPAEANFSPSSDPGGDLDAARAAGRPVLIDFYSNT